MTDIIDSTKNYRGDDLGISYHTVNATVLNGTTTTVTTVDATTVNATTVDATTVEADTLDAVAVKIGGVAVKMPVLSGEYTTTGGAATESATITGVAVGDIVIASLKDGGTSDVTLLTAAENTADTVDFTFSANPLADTIVSYIILR